VRGCRCSSLPIVVGRAQMAAPKGTGKPRIFKDRPRRLAEGKTYGLLDGADGVTCPVCAQVDATPAILRDVAVLTLTRNYAAICKLLMVSEREAQMHIFHALLPARVLAAEERDVFDTFGYGMLLEAQAVVRDAAEALKDEPDAKAAALLTTAMQRLTELAFTLSGRLEPKTSVMIQNNIASGLLAPREMQQGGFANLAEFEEMRRLVQERHGVEIASDPETIRLGAISYREQERGTEVETTAEEVPELEPLEPVAARACGRVRI